LRPIISQRLLRMKRNWVDTYTNSWWTEWLYMKRCKWPPPSAKHTWTRRYMLSTVRQRTSFSVSAIYSLLQMAQKKEFGNVKSGDGGGHRANDEMNPSYSVAMTRSFVTRITQRHLLRPRQVTHTQYLDVCEASSFCFRSFSQELRTKTVLSGKFWLHERLVLRSLISMFVSCRLFVPFLHEITELNFGFLHL
jgi:hypothetical protein